MSGPEGRGAVWTEERGTSDGGTQHPKSGPEASGGEIRVDAARMKTLALLLAESSIELHRPLAEDADYEVRGVVESVERRRSRRIGPFDRITCRFDLLQDGLPAATVINVFAVPRPGEDGTP